MRAAKAKSSAPPFVFLVKMDLAERALRIRHDKGIYFSDPLFRRNSGKLFLDCIDADFYNTSNNEMNIRKTPGDIYQLEILPHLSNFKNSNVFRHPCL